MPEHTILTLGGLWFSDDIRREVVEFNRENPDYQIQLHDYYQGFEDWEEAIDRFRVELIAGSGPDIIVGADYMFANTDYFTDLYAFIDADPELDRTDFFPNVLHSMETLDGCLPFITNGFAVHTNIALRDIAAELEPLTFTNLIKRLDEPDAPYLFGEGMYRDRFLSNAVFFSGDTFIDWTNKRANLDSEEFIDMLEIAARLPIWDGDVGEYDNTEEWRKLLDGEQLLYELWFNSDYSFSRYQVLLNDFVAVGLPTYEGGQHIIRESSHQGIGINALSEHQDVAWSFARRLLLPDAEVQFELPLRIDKYEELIAGLMTSPKGVLWFGDDHHVSVPAMTKEAAAEIREIIDSASNPTHYDRVVWMIIEEDSQAFFAGARSAADTARIMQNRVQTYLNERG